MSGLDRPAQRPFGTCCVEEAEEALRFFRTAPGICQDVLRRQGGGNEALSGQHSPGIEQGRCGRNEQREALSDRMMMERRPARPDRNSRFRLARAFSVDQRLGLRRLLVRCGREVERISQGYEAENAEYRKNHHMLLYARCTVRLPGKMNGADLLSIVRIRACLSSPEPSPSKGRQHRAARSRRPPGSTQPRRRQHEHGRGQ